MVRTVADAVDYKDSPADRTTTGGWVPATLILGIEIAERLSTMGISVNLVTYLGDVMHLPSAQSANIVTDFMGTSFILCLLGGFLADSFLGRFKTIVIFSAVQSLGTALLSMATKLPQLRPPPCGSGGGCERASGLQMGFLYLSLYTIALGTGGLKSSVSGFGTDQFDETNETEKGQMAYFFNRFFLFISTGTLLAVTVLVYIEDEIGRSWAYGICCISMIVAILVLLSGVRRYRYKKSSGSPLVQILQVLAAAAKKRRLPYPADADTLYENADAPCRSRIAHTDRLRCLDKGAIAVEEDYANGGGGGASPSPWRLCTVTRIEEVKMMIGLLPVWATTIFFWTTYAQMITFSVQQASTMERTIHGFTIPAGSLTVFFVGAILVTLTFYDRVIMPLRMKWSGKQGFSDVQRIATGLVFSTVGMGAAALAEMRRQSVARKTNVGGGGGVGPDGTLPITVFLLIPQFFFVGSGEALIYTGQLDFFLTRSPRGMKSMSTGLFLSTLSLGFFVSSLLVSLVNSLTGGKNGGAGWLADNLNEGRLDLFYWLLAVLCVINLAAFLACILGCRPADGATAENKELEEEMDKV